MVLFSNIKLHDHSLTHGKRERALVSLYIKQVTIVIKQYTTMLHVYADGICLVHIYSDDLCLVHVRANDLCLVSLYSADLLVLVL